MPAWIVGIVDIINPLSMLYEIFNYFSCANKPCTVSIYTNLKK